MQENDQQQPEQDPEQDVEQAETADGVQPEPGPADGTGQEPVDDVQDAEFKSEESKQAVLADLRKARDEKKALEEEIARRDREKLSELEKAQAERDDFRSKWETSERQRVRAEVARTKGIDPELLNGSTEEELNAHADRLLAWRGDKPSRTPNPNPAQGAGAPPALSDADKTFYEATGRKAPTH